MNGENIGNREDRIIQTDDVAKEYGLQEPLALEIVMEESRKVLLRSKLIWAILVGGVAIAGWLYVGSDRDSGSGL